MLRMIKKAMPYLAAAILFLVMVPCQALAFERYNSVIRYDPYFSKYSKRFFGLGFDWRYFKAQAIAESGLKPDAKSGVGAVGLMQIMPRTFEEITRKNSYIKGTRAEPRWNIAAGIYYDKKLFDTWKAKRPFKDKMAFTYGAFNAGKGNIIKAQKLAQNQGENPNLWKSIEKTLPGVTGKHSAETLGYVNKIFCIKELIRE